MVLSEQILGVVPISISVPEIMGIMISHLSGQMASPIHTMRHEDSGSEMDKDITSWAEGSLIVTWFEYTPTPALDISLNTVISGLA